MTSGEEPSLAFAGEATAAWFRARFGAPTLVQTRAWPAIAAGESTLLLAPTGTGKTLAAFLVAIDRLSQQPAQQAGVRVLYLSPLKALGADIERNLREPLEGIAAQAKALGLSLQLPRVGVRSGDTSAAERAQLIKDPPEILITTPESLFLMLMSRAASTLRTVETVIVDEVHAMVASKRGAHLALSLERLETLVGRPLQRVALSATQRPLHEVAEFLGGFDAEGARRRVKIIDASGEKDLRVRVELPADEEARRQASSEGERVDVWTLLAPKLLSWIMAHKSTLIFVNSRRLAEQLSHRINELAGEEISAAHHGSVAKDRRAEIEWALKEGALRAMFATATLEMGIDIGSIELVVQIEAPPTIAAGIQRIGRSGHWVGGAPRGVLVPKYRHDLLASAAASQKIEAGEVEPIAYPRVCLDVLAQHLVAMVAAQPAGRLDHDLLAEVRRAAPYSKLSRAIFEGVLEMLSGSYPAERFGSLRARLRWDRQSGLVVPSRGAKLLATSNAGTIPERGLYGVFLAESDKPVRVGELDEEMVFEFEPQSRFVLGTSTWEVDSITDDRVLVRPAPGQTGMLPFWNGEQRARSIEFGRAIGALIRRIEAAPQEASEWLVEEAHLSEEAAEALVAYLQEQRELAGAVPHDRAMLIERFPRGDGECVVLHLPLGRTLHAPWAIAIERTLFTAYGVEADVRFSDDGLIVAFPEVDRVIPTQAFLPRVDEVASLVEAGLVETAFFAARFRDCAGRALLLPRRGPGQRTPLWMLRRRARQLQRIAMEFPEFPIMLEACRECLQDEFDVPALEQTLRAIHGGEIALREIKAPRPSPFASSLLFNYATDFIFEGEQPMAERHAQALVVDRERLKELLGPAELRTLLHPDAVRAVWRRLQKLDHPIRDLDDLHDHLRRFGDQREEEVARRPIAISLREGLQELARAGRAIAVTIHGEARWIAIEDLGLYRGLIDRFSTEVNDDLIADSYKKVPRSPMRALIERFARTRTPFGAGALEARYGRALSPHDWSSGLAEAVQRGVLTRGALVERSLLIDGGGAPGQHNAEGEPDLDHCDHCDVDVLAEIQQRALAIARAEVEPVSGTDFALFLLAHQGVLDLATETPPRLSIDTLIDRLAGASLAAPELPATLALRGVGIEALEVQCLSGAILWRGIQRGRHLEEGRIELSRRGAQEIAALPPPAEGEEVAEIRTLLQTRGALFLEQIYAAIAEPRGLTYPDLSRRASSNARTTPPSRALTRSVLDAIWALVWAGEVSNDALRPLLPQHLSWSSAIPSGGGVAGRWFLLPREGDDADKTAHDKTVLAYARARSLLDRFGVVMRECMQGEAYRGGFSAVYPVLREMESHGKIRRGRFVQAGDKTLGGVQFAAPKAADQLRATRSGPRARPRVHVVPMDDPANPFGVFLPWPRRGFARRLGGRLVLIEGRLAAYLKPNQEELLLYPREAEEAEGDVAWVARALARAATLEGRALRLRWIDGEHARFCAVADHFLRAGFVNAGSYELAISRRPR